MSRINARGLLALGLAALALRMGVAILTEYRPIFPPHYYTDAVFIDASAVEALEARRAGREYSLPASLSQRLQVDGLSRLYSLIGHRPFAAKILNAAMGAAAAILLVAALIPGFGARPALFTGWSFALWPSCAFFTSQNFKEAPVCAFSFAAMAAMAPLLADAPREPRRRIALAATATIALIALGLMRPPVLLALGISWAAVATLRIARARRFSPGETTVLAACLIGMASYTLIARSIKNSVSSHGLHIDAKQIQVEMIPRVYDYTQTQKMQGPTTLEGLSIFRRVRLDADRKWAKAHRDREIGTQIYPDAEFKNWGQLFAFIPKGALTALYQPLPGLYPLERKPGRWAAATENLILFALSIAAILGAARGARTPARAAPLAFFFILAAAAGLLELDLGSASRHKILYLPMLFPFAAEFVLRFKERA